jgi:hypothetical protein
MKTVTLCLFTLLVISPAKSQSPSSPGPSDNWLHPNETAYLAAVDDGFSGRAQIGPYNEDKGGIHQVWIQFDSTGGDFNTLVFFSPLRCAQILGINARQKLREMPTVEDARKICDGVLFVNVQYITKSVTADFPIVVKHGAEVLRALSTDFTAIPQVTANWNGFSYDMVYGYSAVFYFRPPEPWSDGVSIRYVIPERGDPVTARLDLSKFVSDESTYRSSMSVSPGGRAIPSPVQPPGREGKDAASPRVQTPERD